MELLQQLVDLFLHLDKHLGAIVADYGTWTYAVLFLIIFCETGLVVTPFLPGDSLLFAAGALAATTVLNVHALVLLLFAAAVAGDALNYTIGKTTGELILSKPRRFIRREHIDRTHAFYEKHGGKTIVFARFVPIVRTFAPFVAGVGHMAYMQFATYNIVGGLIWVTLFTYAGYFFGGIPFVKNNFSVVVLAIIFVSLIPMIAEFVRSRREAGRRTA